MNPRVLIVDDSLTVRMDLEEAFTEAGFTPVLSAEPRQAPDRCWRKIPLRLRCWMCCCPTATALNYLAKFFARIR